MTETTPENIGKLIDLLADKTPCNCSPVEACNGVQGQHLKPIVLGDCLAKMDTEDLIYAHPVIDEKLIELWQPLGFARSLQEIVQESGYELLGSKSLLEIKDGKMIRAKETQRLRDPQARALCEFLMDLFQPNIN